MHGSAQARQIQHAQQALQGMSVPFEANSGQFDPAVAFTGRTFAGAIHVTRQGQIVYSLAAPTQQQGVTSAPPPEMPPQAPPKKPPRTPAGTKPQAPPQTPPATRPLSGWSLTETLAGALPLSPTGGEAAATQITRFSGPHSYQPATYRNLHLGQAWPGVQVELAMRGANVEKLFHVAPQADPGQIQVRVDGALSLRLGKGGELIAATGHGDVAYTAPVAFQEVTGQRVEVPVQYALNSQGDGYGFALGAYDRALPLVIDPLLQSTYLGGDGDSTVLALVIAPSGEVLVGGITADNSSLGAFPGTAGGAQPSTGGTDGFIARLSADLRTLEQSTYLGGSGQNSVIALAISPSGEVLATGITSSTDFPGTADGAQSVAAGGFYDGFIARLSADLRTLEQSTYLGGPQSEDPRAMAIAPTGEVLVAGNTSSTQFPGTTGGAQPVAAGWGNDGFVARLSADLRTLAQSTYLGGAGYNVVQALTISPSGEVLVAGDTSSTDFPGTAGGAQPVAAGGRDGFIARLSADLRTLEQSTYLGGSQFEDLYAMAIAPTGEVLVAGSTSSTQFPGTAGGAQPVAAGGGNDGFVARLSADLRTLAQSTYLGGAGYNVVQALTIAPSGDVLAGGYTDAIHFPGTAGGAQSVNNGGFYDGFIARLSASLRTLEQSTYLGGTDMEAISTLAIAPSGEVLVGGLTYSRNFPGAAGGAQPGTNSSGVIGFITRLSADLRAVSPQTITFAPQASQVLGSPGSTFTIDPPAMASSGLPVDYGSATPAICTVSGTTVTMLDDGICTLVARQAGNAQWQAADANADVRIRRAQAIRFPAQASRSFEAGTVFAIDPPATASSGLPVEYASTTPGICTVSGNRVTMAGEGICTVTASQPGDARWMPATGVAQDIELTAVVPPPVTPPVIPPVTPPVTPPVPPPAPAPIPALGAWPLALLGAMAAGCGAHALRRRGAFSARRTPAPRLRTGRHRSSGSC
ncbi:DUF7948 domain-containing protein [Delftia acidovorans]